MINPENIPEELRARPQWVCWSREKSPQGKPTKIPYSPETMHRASSTDPATWATFDQALFRYRGEEADGVGYVFSADDPYTGIDLDDVIDPATGAIDPDAYQTIDRFGTYHERSVSKTGVHLILKGKLPPGGRKRGDHECYDSGRFFVFTGDTFGKPLPIEERQHTLAIWHGETFPTRDAIEGRHIARVIPPTTLDDATLLLKIEASKQGEKFLRLWKGDTDAYKSGSEADLALCSILSFWTQGDEAAVDRLFRASGLMRAKWDARRGESTYGKNTVARAVATSAKRDPEYRVAAEPPVVFGPLPTVDGERARRFKWMSELTAPPKADDWLWEGYLPTAGVVLLSALWKVGKTTLLSHLLKACEAGGSFLGRPIKASKILYVSEEGERHWVRRRDAMGLSDNTGMLAQPFAARPGKADWLGLVGEIAADVERYGFQLVVFDTLAKLWPVQEENDAGAVDEALMPLWRITKAGAGVLLIHHLRKSGGQEYTGSRGSGALSAFPDIIIELTRFDATDRKSTKRTITAKGRYDETPEELVIELVDGSYRVVDDAEIKALNAANQDESRAGDEGRVLAALQDSPQPWMTTKDIQTALRANGPGLRDADVATYLASLMAREIIHMRGKLRSNTQPRQWAVAARLLPVDAALEMRAGMSSESAPDDGALLLP